ncbi:MAG TPA: hypothetical protein VFV66_20125 [Nonomuraea sp.]|nr:hypothetical protein [Nonomuraea sp.]
MRTRMLALLTCAATLTPALAPAASASAATAPDLSGAAVYAGKQVSRYTGGRWSTLARSPLVAVSPDGAKTAWVTSGGWLRVRQGGETTTLVSGLPGATACHTPVWSADSAQVAYVTGDTITAVRADATAAPRPLGRSPGVCHLAWSASGRYVAGHTATALHRLDVKTGKTLRLALPVAHVQSLSPDGREAIVALPRDRDASGGRPARFKPVVVNLVTGKRSTPDVKGRLVGAHHLADGRTVVRVAGAAHNTLVVLDERGAEVQRVAEPARAKGQALLQVLP